MRRPAIFRFQIVGVNVIAVCLTQGIQRLVIHADGVFGAQRPGAGDNKEGIALALSVQRVL